MKKIILLLVLFVFTNSFVVQDDNAVIRGMVRKVEHLVTVEEVQD
jgi:large subunit ribosomal protein L30